ncbi:MAG: DUF3365 domain-containing protein [Azospirillum sp.]|nr:DUF3365 domain-containing protein [Azospirillum sp.]
MGIRGKIILAMVAAFTVGLVSAGTVAYKILIDNAREETLQKARVMMESATAIRAYTAAEIRPLLEEQLKVQFLPYSVPSFAAQNNFKKVQRKIPEYSYREPALNPTNLNDRATDWEADIINAFRNDAELKELVTARDTPTGAFLTLARPIRVSSQACLECHSKPEAAPATMIALYGSNNGFGWTLNEAVAAQVVSIPLTVPVERAFHTLLIFLGALVAIFAMIILLVDFLLRRIVVRPVVEIAKVASDVSMGQMDAPEYVRDSKDEIGSLAASFNRMRRSLQNAMKMLED